MATSPPKEYIVIGGLEIMYTIKAGYDDGWPMDYEVRGLTVRNCHIGYIGVRSIDNNLYYQNDPSQRLTDNPSGSYNMDDWAEYIADTGWEQHSPEPANPLFVDPENGDFHLLTGSPAMIF